MCSKEKLILQEFNHFEIGSVFSIIDFSSSISNEELLEILKPYIDSNQVQIILPDIFYKTKISRIKNFEKPLPPTLINLLNAIGRLTHEVFQYGGAYSANLLGLSTQVPIYDVFYTSGKSRSFTRMGKAVVKLIHTDNHYLFQFPNEPAGHAISALIYLGEKNVDYKIISIIKDKLSHQDYEKLINAELPSWLNNSLKSFKDTNIKNTPQFQKYNNISK